MIIRAFLIALSTIIAFGMVSRANADIPEFAKAYPKKCNFPVQSSECAAASARAVLQSDETIIGAWIDEKHPAGFVVITKTATGHSHIHSYFQGGSSRTYSSEKEPLVQTTFNTGLRVWETPVAVSKRERHMGEEVPVYYDASGDVIDVYRFVEQPDGTLLCFQYISFEFSKRQPSPWMIGRPFKFE